MRFRPRMHRTHSLVFVALLMVGCGESAPPAPTSASVVDSAGIRMVTSTAAAWDADADRWTVSAAPAVSIGVIEGDAPYLLDDVKGASRLADGSIVLLNGGDGQLRFYDSDGRFIKAEAGLGQGPGELERPTSLIRLADGSLLAGELAGWKRSRFDQQGEFLSTSRLDNARLSRLVDSIWGCPVNPGFVADGRYVGCAGSGIPRPQVPGYDRVSHWYFMTDAAVSTVDTVGAAYGFGSDVLLGAFGAPMASGGDPLEVYVGDPAIFEITRWVDSTGLDMIIRYPSGLRPIDESIRASYREAYPGSAERDGVAFAPTLPAFQHLARDSEGHLWVTKYTPRWEDAGGSWIFAPSGELLGEVDLPPGFRPLEIGADYVLGLVSDDLGVEQVLLFALERGA